jgi:acylphosphatase
MDSPAVVARATVLFSGRVQGVGFRYQTRQVAKGYEVTGLVENLADGRVQLVAEGPRREVEAFVTAVAEQMAGYIKNLERSTDEGPRQFAGFSIR